MVKLNRVFRNIATTVVVFAVVFSVVLLAKDAGMEILPQLTVNEVSAISLLSVGVAFLIIQPMMRLRAKELLKNVLLAVTFILWGIVQLMPQNVLSTRLGNLVVALFVVDLGWAVLLGVRPTQEPMPDISSAKCSPQQTVREQL